MAAGEGRMGRRVVVARIRRRGIRQGRLKCRFSSHRHDKRMAGAPAPGQQAARPCGQAGQAVALPCLLERSTCEGGFNRSHKLEFPSVPYPLEYALLGLSEDLLGAIADAQGRQSLPRGQRLGLAGRQ